MKKALRPISAGAAAVGVGVVAVTMFAGCGHTTEAAPQRSPSSAPAPVQPSATPPAAYDISRVDDVSNDFPAGFTVQAHPAKMLQQQDIDSSSLTAFTAAQVDPPQCRPAVIPPYADPVTGTTAAGVRAAGDQGNIYVVALRSPKPNPVSVPPAGCDRMALSGSPETTGTVERVPAPAVVGVTTTGVKMTGTDPEDNPDYLYTAALDDQTTVVVMGSADEQLDPQQLLADLLVKATSAVRGP